MAPVRSTIASAYRRLRGEVSPEDAARLFAHLRVNGSEEGLDDLALAATRGRLRLDDLLETLARRGPAVAKRFEPRAARDLAMLLADLGRSGEATVLFGAMVDVLGPRSLGKEGRFAYAELLVEAGLTHDLPALMDSLFITRDDAAQSWLLRANAANPFRADRESGEWLDAVSSMFAVDGLEPLTIATGDGAAFDRIRVAATEGMGGPLVTVIIPTYAPGPRLATAVESLLAQTHQSLQLLIMDDGSPADAASELDRWAARDPRIEVVHLPQNNGPYLARNIAVAEYARGEYVTVHDDDDWSHPGKIERQVAHLEAHPQVVANMCNGVRASDDLWFGRVNGNPVWTQQALSSLMVRRSVFERIGYWDVLNRSADAEFNDRIRSWTDGRIPVVGRVPLMLYRMRWGSLSDGEFRRGYMDPRRRWYFQSYRAWHESCRAEGRPPHLPVDDRAARVFSAPVDLQGSRQAEDLRRIDTHLVVATDFRDKGGAVEDAIGAVASSLERGETVGILQLDSPAADPAAVLDPRILRLGMHAGARIVSLKDAVSTPAVAIFGNAVLTYLPRTRSAIDAERVTIVSGDVDAASRDVCRAVFGTAPDEESPRLG